MAVKRIAVDGVGDVAFYKRRGTKSIRISLSQGEVRVTQPYWVPYKAAVQFVVSRRDWIAEHYSPRKLLYQNQQIGKAHHIRFERSAAPRIQTRVTQNTVRVGLPEAVDADSEEAQARARSAAVRALTVEAKALLPQRLRQLADTHGFTYNAVTIKTMKTRWGSCNSKQEIALNCHLMQLPWDLIDYVLVHELVHTKHMAHDKAFWSAVEDIYANYKQLKKQLRAHASAV